MQDGVGGAAAGRDAGDGVFDGGLGDDCRWGDIVAQKIEDQFSGALAGGGFGGVGGGDAGESHGSNAEKFADHGHGVGGELTAAGACTGAGSDFEGVQLGVAHVAAGMFSHGFKNVLNGYGMAFKLAGGDGAAVQNKAGNIQAGNGHDSAGNGFVAADENDQGVEKIATGDQFDGVRDDFAADERGAHAFGAHGDAVRDGDGVEFERRAARGADAFLDVDGEFAQVVVTGSDFDPSVGYADQGFVEVGVAQAGGAQHGAGRGAICAIGQNVAAGLQRRLRHDCDLRSQKIVRQIFCAKGSGNCAENKKAIIRNGMMALKLCAAEQ